MRARKPKRRQYCRRCGYELTQLVAGTENFHCPRMRLPFAEPARMGMTSNFWWVPAVHAFGVHRFAPPDFAGLWILDQEPLFLDAGVLNPFVAIVAAIIFCPGDVPGKAMYGRCLPFGGYVANCGMS